MKAIYQVTGNGKFKPALNLNPENNLPCNEEVFKTIKGFNGKYQISNHGKVKSFAKVKPKILKQKLGWLGDLTVEITEDKKKRTVYVKDLMIEQFLPKPKELLTTSEVQYIDGDRWNNRLDNLIWAEN